MTSSTLQTHSSQTTNKYFCTFSGTRDQLNNTCFNLTIYKGSSSTCIFCIVRSIGCRRRKLHVLKCSTIMMERHHNLFTRVQLTLHHWFLHIWCRCFHCSNSILIFTVIFTCTKSSVTSSTAASSSTSPNPAANPPILASHAGPLLFFEPGPRAGKSEQGRASCRSRDERAFDAGSRPIRPKPRARLRFSKVSHTFVLCTRIIFIPM